MHDRCQVHITRNHLIFAHQFTPDYSRTPGHLLRKGWFRGLIDKTREAAVFFLAALSIGSLLLGGVYFFFVQLARYGW